MATMILSRRGMIWTACAVLAILADWLFYLQPIGWTLAIFTAATALLVTLRSPALRKTWPGRIAIVLMAIILLALVEEPSPLALLMVAVTLGTLVMMGEGGAGHRWQLEIGAWARRWRHLLLTLWTRVFLDNRIVSQWFRRHPTAKPRLIRVMVRWVLPLAGGLIFILIFAVANPIIEDWVHRTWDKIWTLLDWLPLWLGPGRLTLWVLVALGAYGLLRYRMSRSAAPVRIPPVVRPPSRFGHEPIVRCLIVFNAVFALETILDCIYLFGGASLPHGMTYKEYAHRGAYPLVATALLTALFVLLTFRTGGPAQRSAWARRLVYLWIGQNIFLMISTIWRLWLYVDADGLTRLRISTMIWLGLVGLGFVYTIMKIIQSRSNAWLWRMNIITTFITLYACAFLNFDGFIAHENVTHCKEATGQGEHIDLAYLRHLGPESLPALQWLRERDPQDRDKIDPLISDLRTELAQDLSDWRGWTYRRWREAPADLRTEARAAYARWYYAMHPLDYAHNPSPIRESICAVLGGALGLFCGPMTIVILAMEFTALNAIPSPGPRLLEICAVLALAPEAMAVSLSCIALVAIARSRGAIGDLNWALGGLIGVGIWLTLGFLGYLAIVQELHFQI